MLCKRLISLVVPVLCFSINILAHIEKSYYLEGTFGKERVGLQITNADGYWNGRYFFMESKKDVYLVATHEANHIILKSTVWDEKTSTQKVVEMIEIKEDSSYNWQGYWKSKEGMIHDVKLQPIKKEINNRIHISNHFKSITNPYTLLRLADMELKKGKKQKIAMGIIVRWFIEPKSRVSMFRIERGIEDSLIDKMNEKLLEIHLNNIEGYYSCGQVGIDGIYEQKIEITFLNRHVMSFINKSISNCYNLNTTTRIEYFNIDMERLELINLEEIVWMGNGDVPRAGSREFFLYRRTVFPEKVMEILQFEHAEEWNKKDCDYNNSKIWSFPDWYLTKKGIKLVVNHYQLAETCKNPSWTILPYNSIEKYLNEDFLK